MKLCAACNQVLPKEKFSKKQWKLKQPRRCKECIADNREVELEGDDDEPTLSCAPSEGTPCWSDEDLFKQPPPTDECPICLLQLPIKKRGESFYSCCGKTICDGCIYAAHTADQYRLGPFCRASQIISDGEHRERLKKRAKANDSVAILSLGCYYASGGFGLPQNFGKAMELWFQAGELGSTEGYYNIAQAYNEGRPGVERDAEQAKYYWKLAAMGGNMLARHNIGCYEGECRQHEQSNQTFNDCGKGWIGRFFVENPTVLCEWACNEG